MTCDCPCGDGGGAPVPELDDLVSQDLIGEDDGQIVMIGKQPPSS